MNEPQTIKVINGSNGNECFKLYTEKKQKHLTMLSA